MASPFSVFRKYQLIFLVVFGVMLMVAFVIAPPVLDYLQTQRVGSGTGDDAVVVETKHGKLRESDLDRMRQAHNVAVYFLHQVVQETSQREGTPRGVQRNAFGQITDPGIPATSSDTNLVHTFLLAKEAESMGMVVTNEAVMEFLEQLSDGELSRGEFGRIFNETMGERVTQEFLFERLRTELLAQKMRSMNQIRLAAGAQGGLTPGKAWQYFKRLNRQVKAELVPLEVAEFEERVEGEPTEAQIRQIYEEGKDRFAHPDDPEPGFKRRRKATFQYVKAELDDFVEPQKAKVIDEITDEEIEQHYEENKQRYVVPAEQPAAEDQAAESPADVEMQQAEQATEEPGEEEGTQEEGTEEAATEQEAAEEQATDQKPAEDEPVEEPAGEEKASEENAADEAATDEEAASSASEEESPQENADNNQQSEPENPGDSDSPEETEAQGAEAAAGEDPGAGDAPEEHSTSGLNAADRTFFVSQDEPSSDEPAAGDAPSAADSDAPEEAESAEAPAADDARQSEAQQEEPADQAAANADSDPEGESTADEAQEGQPELQPAQPDEPESEEGTSKTEDVDPEQTNKEEPQQEESGEEAAPEQQDRGDEEAAAAEAEAAEEQPAQEGPPQVGPGRVAPDQLAPGQEQEEPEYRPLDEELREEIREELAEERARAIAEEQMEEAFNEVQRQVDQYASDYRSYTIRRETVGAGDQQEAEEFDHLDLEELETGERLSKDQATKVDAITVRDHDIGQASRMEFTSWPPEQISFSEMAFGEDVPFYVPEQIRDAESGLTFLYWKIWDQEPYVPELKEVHDEVVAAWRKQEALKLARARAEELTERAKEANQPLTEVVGDEELKVIETDPFSWMTTGSTPAGMGMGQLSLGDIEGVEGEGPEMMKSIFSLKQGEVGQAVNQPHSVVYVVRIAEEQPGEEQLRQNFLRSGMAPELVQLARSESSAVQQQWYRQLEDKMEVTWHRQPRSDG